MMLAEQVATDINWTLICTIIMAIGTLGMWLDSRKNKTTTISNQPLSVEMVKALHDQFASKDEFTAHVKENKDEISRINRERGEDLRAASGSRKTMYDKQDEMRRELTDRIDEVRDNLTSKIESIPDKVISTLRNAGAIGGNHD